MNEFAFSPIGNNILEKLKEQSLEEYSENLYKNNPNLKRPCFEFENNVGIAIRKKIEFISESVYPEISKWDDSQIEEFALDILGSIKFKKEELEKLKKHIKSLPEK